MADLYVYSGSGSTPKNGSDWAHGYTTLAAAATASGAGDRLFVAHDHSESTAGAVTITMPGTAANCTQIICVNRLGTVPPVAADLRTTASIAVGASNSTLSINGFGYVYGCQFLGGTGTGTASYIAAAATAGNKISFKNCLFQTRSTGAAGGHILVGGATVTGEVYAEGCTYIFGNNAGNILMIFGNATFRACSFTYTTTLPNILFQGRAANCPVNLLVEGCDLSAWSNTLLQAIGIGRGVFKDCKIHASATILGNNTLSVYDPVELIRSDSDNTNYKRYLANYHGTLTTDTAYRSGGATDGVTPHSWKIVTTANCTIATRFECPPIKIWNEVTSGTISLTMYGVGASVPYNDELIFEAWVLGDASYPLASKVSTEMTLLATHAALDTDSTSTWNGYTTAPFSATLTLSPLQKGYIYIYIKASKASSTYYIDPRPIITGRPQVSRSSLGENELFAGISRARIGSGM